MQSKGDCYFNMVERYRELHCNEDMRETIPKSKLKRGVGTATLREKKKGRNFAKDYNSKLRNFKATEILFEMVESFFINCATNPSSRSERNISIKEDTFTAYSEESLNRVIRVHTIVA